MAGTVDLPADAQRAEYAYLVITATGGLFVATLNREDAIRRAEREMDGG
jgi:hypothetical protein